jgi:NitT/TauT family transport system substrate-binding protein
MHKKACTLIRENPGKAAKLVSKEIKGLNPEFVKATYTISPKYCAALSPQYITSTLAFVPILKKLGYIKKILGEKEVFETSYIEKVHPEPPHY